MLLMHGTCDRCVDLLARSEGLFSITTPRTEDAMDESNDIDVVLGETARRRCCTASSCCWSAISQASAR
jgi:hypothetical protein